MVRTKDKDTMQYARHYTFTSLSSSDICSSAALRIGGGAYRLRSLQGGSQ